MSKTGRNDACPCGSGKKYKKCCLGNDEIASRSKAASSTSRATSSTATNDRIPHPQQHSYAAAKRAERLGKTPMLWTRRSLAAMTEREILRRLSSLGVDVTSDTFASAATEQMSAWALSREWLKKLGRSVDRHDDIFLGLAAVELWKRYLPDRPCIEMADDWLTEGYERMEEDPRGAADLWWRLWRYVAPMVEPEMRTFAAVQGFLVNSEFLLNWVQDFSDLLVNLARDSQAAIEDSIRFHVEVLERFPDESALTIANLRAELANLNFAAGRPDEGERILRNLISERPSSAIGYVRLADALAEARGLEHAVALLEEAKAHPVDDADDWDVDYRLEHYRRRLTETSAPAP